MKSSLFYVCVFFFTTLIFCVCGGLCVYVCLGVDALHELYTTAGIYILSVLGGLGSSVVQYIEDNNL